MIFHFINNNLLNELYLRSKKIIRKSLNFIRWKKLWIRIKLSILIIGVRWIKLIIFKKNFWLLFKFIKIYEANKFYNQLYELKPDETYILYKLA